MKTSNIEHSTANAEGQWRAGVPDSDITVVFRQKCEEYPIWIGFHDGADWWTAAADLVEVEVIGWLHLHEAAHFLDVK